MSQHIASTYMLPLFPKKIISSFGFELKSSLDYQITQLVEEAIATDKAKDETFKLTRTVFTNTNRLAFGLRTGSVDNIESLLLENENILKQLITSNTSRNAKQSQISTIASDMTSDISLPISTINSLRDNRLSFSIEKFIEIKLFYHFLTNGCLMKSTDIEICNDDEYIASVLGFAQELSRYAVGRAGEGDIHSVQLCKNLVVELNGKMLEFNFRNGHLRRKYDSLKYSLRNLENMICELSLLNIRYNSNDNSNSNNIIEGNINDSNKEDSTNEISKKPKMEIVDDITLATNDNTSVQISNNIDLADLENIRLRMEKQDIIREDAIKLSRDVQKLSKQAIYAIHKGNTSGYEEANKKLINAQATIIKIQQLIQMYPNLRQGAVSGCIEEWVEGKLFLKYAENKIVEVLQSFLPVDVFSAEYIGGLSDFTGELGRIAVNKATQRDTVTVSEILQVMLIISSAISEANIGGRYNKKSEAVTINLKKVEDLAYELSLQKLGGRALNSLREREIIDINAATTAGNDEDI